MASTPLVLLTPSRPTTNDSVRRPFFGEAAIQSSQDCACLAEHDAHDDKRDWAWELPGAEEYRPHLLPIRTRASTTSNSGVCRHSLLAFSGFQAPSIERLFEKDAFAYGSFSPHYRVLPSLLGTPSRYTQHRWRIGCVIPTSSHIPSPTKIRHMTNSTDVELPLLWIEGLRISLETTSGRPRPSSSFSIIASSPCTYLQSFPALSALRSPAPLMPSTPFISQNCRRIIRTYGPHIPLGV